MVVLSTSLVIHVKFGVMECWSDGVMDGLRNERAPARFFTHYSIAPLLQYSNNYVELAFSFERTGTIAFSGQIWAQTAQPVQRSALI